MTKIALALLVAVTAGCRAQTAENLFDCAECPANKRCNEQLGRCVDNSPPEIAPLSPVAAVAGIPIAITVTVIDPDGDEPTVTWEQVTGSTEIFSGTREGATLDLTADDLGTFVGSLAFTVTADDGYGGEAEATVSVTVSNHEPVLAPADTQYILPGDPFSFNPEPIDGFDPDGHPVTVEWLRMSGPVVTFGTEVSVDGDSHTLSGTLTELGAYLFRATPNDGFEDGDPVEYQVVVQPELAVIYINQAAPDPGGEDCGSFEIPCTTLSDGIAALRNGGTGTTMMVAANTGASAYEDCFDLAGDEILRGAFTPDTWQWVPALRDRTRIVCDAIDGHTMVGSARVQDVTLSSSVADETSAQTLTIASTTQAPPEDPPTETPVVLDVNVESAACGAACLSIGVVVLNTTATLSGVDISGRVSGFDVVREFIGLTGYGGSVTVEGHDSRGSVLLNMPAVEMSWGILMGRGELAVTGIEILGGYSSYLYGIEIWGGDLTVEGLIIDMEAFGSQAVVGIQGRSCPVPTTQWPCRCAVPGVCDTPPIPPDPISGPVHPLVSVFDSSITLRGSSAATAQVPCVGLGIAAGSKRYGHQISGNTVILEDTFNFGAGLYLATEAVSVPEGEGDQITDNQVTVEGGHADSLCLLSDILDTGSETSGAVGAGIIGDETVFADNTLTVGTHDTYSIGLWTHETTGQVITGNQITVSNPLLSATAWSPYAAGASLSGTDRTDGESVFAGNDVRIGSAVEYSSAVDLVTDPDRPNLFWTLVNNFLYGGDGLYPTGLTVTGGTDACQTGGTDVCWPQIYGNTIYGGGHYGTSLISHGVALTFDFDNEAMTFSNNLVDAGKGIGRRFLLDNPKGGFFASGADVVTQFVGTAGGPTPTFIYVPQRYRPADPTYFVLYEGSGEIAEVVDDGALVEVKTTPTRGQVDAIWAGDVGFQTEWIVTIMGDQIGQATLQGWAESSATNGVAWVVDLTPFVLVPAYSFETGSSQRRYPAAVLGGDFDSEYPSDILFVEGPGSGAAEGGMWLVRQYSGQGFQSPEPVPTKDESGEVTLEDPYFLAKTYKGGVIVGDRTAEGTKLYFGSREIGVAEASLELWGVGDTTDVLDIWNGHLGEDGVGVDDELTDIIVLTEQQIVLLIDFDISAGSLAPATFYRFEFPSFLAYTPCALSGTGAVPAAFTVGNLTMAAIGDEIAIGCSDGLIEVFSYNAAPSSYELGGVTSSALEFSSLAVQGGCPDCRLFVAEPNANRLVTYGLNAGFLNVDLTLPLLTDIAMYYDGVHTADFTDVWLHDPLDDGDGTQCPLSLLQDTGPAFAYTYDLHLDPAAGTGHACHNSGQMPDEPAPYTGVDIDGDSRDAATPDVGADEAP